MSRALVVFCVIAVAVNNFVGAAMNVCLPADAVARWPVVLRNSERSAFYVHYECGDGYYREAHRFSLLVDGISSGYVLRDYAAYQNEVSR